MKETSVTATLRCTAENLEVPDLAAAKSRILEAGADSFFMVGSPLGVLYVGYGERGVTYATPRATDAADFARSYSEKFGRLVVPAEDSEVENLRRLVERAVGGEKVGVTVDFTSRTPFQRRVLEVVGGISRGEVRSYGWVAAEAGKPRASRAVGTVMANNPVPLIVPCHRVIKNDGTPGNYGFDPEEKVRLLEEEGVPLDDLARAPYVATPNTGVVCHATCRHAKRIKPENRREFKNISVAFDFGFRPCKVCRPVAAA